MNGNLDVKKHLNEALKIQLTAINQYFLHARMCKNWGLGKFNAQEYGYSIKAMKQADQLIERILFLEGLPNLQSLGKLLIGENVPEMIANDQTLNEEMRQGLLAAIQCCEAEQDYVSRELLAELLEHTEDQLDWLTAQQWFIDNSNLENYLQSMI